MVKKENIFFVFLHRYREMFYNTNEMKTMEQSKMTEEQFDKKLNIQTTGRMDSHADRYHHPYEPTPYCVLERLVNSGYITRENKVIDYGCGKGRVGFFLYNQLGCEVIGIEYNEQIYKEAEENLRTYVKGLKNGIKFICSNAENYQVEEADCFYFFNPFSMEILQSVIGRIVDSYYDNPRAMQLFFYYPSDEYISYLMTNPNLMFCDEIDCHDLFTEEMSRERILIFELV